jgi:outer membrane biosynthesis protein TonB
MAKYLIRNNRKNRIVSIRGRILASVHSSVDNKPGEMWLSEEIYSKKSVQRLLELKRIVLVRVDGEPSAPPAAAAAPKPAPVPEPAPEPVPEPVVEEPAPEPEPEPEPEVEEDSIAVVQEDGDIVPASQADEEGTHVYTESELSDLTLPYIRPIAKKMGVDTSGMRKAEIIQAILDSQES